MGVGTDTEKDRRKRLDQVVPSGELGSLVGKLYDLEIQKASLVLFPDGQTHCQGFWTKSRFHRASIPHSTPVPTPSFWTILQIQSTGLPEQSLDRV